MAVIIHNETAYYAGARRNIIANAKKTFAQTYEDYEAVLAFIANGRIFDGGSFVSYEENFVGSLAKAYDNFGKLSEKQVAAVRKSIAERAKRRAEWADKQAALNATRTHIGTVGEKITLTLTVKKILRLAGQYGMTLICICEDADGNVVIYKGYCEAFDLDLPSGETKTITVKATVSEHGVRDGVKQTVIKRPKAV